MVHLLYFLLGKLLCVNKLHELTGFFQRGHIGDRLAGDRWLGTNYGAWASSGALGTYSRSLYIPTDVAPGTYYLGFLVDSGGAVGEGNEGNNSQPMPRTITIY